jgi:formate hydrogenlyase subunit 3/multisubunit Na+/H+ antiporter MnhD subunit
MVTTVAAFVLVALALCGVPGLSRIWPELTIAAASLSRSCSSPSGTTD